MFFSESQLTLNYTLKDIRFQVQNGVDIPYEMVDFLSTFNSLVSADGQGSRFYRTNPSWMSL